MLVDDHEVVRMGLKALLDRQPDLSVIAEAATEQEALEQAGIHQPDIILMDIRLSSGSGIDACRRIVDKYPGTKVIMLTSYAEDELLFASIQSGAIGYVLKQADSRELLRAITNAARGDGALDPSLTQRVFDEVRRSVERRESDAFSELTAKEKLVLMHISDGETNRVIAEKLFLSEGTVRNYVSNILSKLSVSNRAEAAAFAIKHRLRDIINEND